MDYSKVMEQLKQASLFDLYRLQAAIGHQLENPERIREIRGRLKADQDIVYFDAVENRLVEARVVKLKRTRLLVESKHDKQRWDIPFYWVNLDGADADLSFFPAEGLDRSALGVGDRVGFRDKQNNDVYGEVIRLNRKTATIVTDDRAEWRVDYRLLHLVIDGEQAGGPLLVEGKVTKKW